jgi:hypothetical protein
MQKTFMLLLALLLALTGAAIAQVSPTLSSWGIVCTGTMEVSNCPGGGFEAVSDGCPPGAASIWITVIDVTGAPIPGIPRTDIWVDACNPDPTAPDLLCICPGQNITDSPTNAAGTTTITGTLFYGGCVVSDGLACFVLDPVLGVPVQLMTPQCIGNIRFKSPDINASCTVNLSDLSFFALAYGGVYPFPPYDPCCDYNDDGRVNISDFAYFGVHYQHTCP